VVVDGKVKAAILRQTPQLVGDGTSTIAELLENENAARRQLRMQYVSYQPLDSELITQAGKQSTEILPKGEVLTLGLGTMIRTGASVYNVLSEVHPSYIRTAENLAENLGSRFIVVDIMIHDYTKPQSDTNYAFIEFNTAPVFKLFYSCRDGNHYDILSDIVPMLDDAISGERHD
jgi:cyanophycin synthetase